VTPELNPCESVCSFQLKPCSVLPITSAGLERRGAFYVTCILVLLVVCGAVTMIAPPDLGPRRFPPPWRFEEASCELPDP
jgi:hypothetical protein